ncbi:MAG: TDT family transporter [Actinomycetes bacterium]
MSIRAHRLLVDLDHPRQALSHIGPNWYASVMGTGIVANAAASLPVRPPGLLGFAETVWVADVLLLVVVTAATVAHWWLFPRAARGHALDPFMAQFYGAPPMATLTVGAGALLVGRHVVGLPTALGIDAVLWSIGTVAGLLSAVGVPYLMFTRHDLDQSSTFASWLMSIVPPMVSAATGALLVPYLPAGQPRTTLLYACWAMFGMGLLASLVTITLVWSRLAYHKETPATMTPSLWIVLGPLGQSVTAAGLLGTAASQVLPGPVASTMRTAGILYGVPVWGFAVMWAAIAAAMTIRTVRSGMPFALTWWSFTFPVGTVVTGTNGLAHATGLEVFVVASVLLYAGLVAAWVLVATRTIAAVARGWILLPPRPRTDSVPVPAPIPVPTGDWWWTSPFGVVTGSSAASSETA